MTRKTGTTASWPGTMRSRTSREPGLSAEREATAEELARIARALDLLACTSLEADYTIAPTVGGRYRLSGRSAPTISQACVVTLEPVDSTIDEAFEAMFWPQERMPEPADGELAIDEEPEREPIVAGQIAVGRVVFESLAAAIDPFPRKPDATLDLQQSPAADAARDKPASPFAVLANLKPKD